MKGVGFILILSCLWSYFLYDANGQSYPGRNITRLESFLKEENLDKKNITILDFSDNLVITIEDTTVFIDFARLSVLNLNNNFGFHFKKNSTGLESSTVKIFSCDKCNITEIRSNTFSELPKLQTLSLKENGMNSIEADAFTRNTELVDLSLQGNEFVELPEKLVENLNLKSLFFDNNSLYNFPEAKPFLISKTLEVFTCSACGVAVIYKKTFTQVPQLRVLNLQWNFIHHVPDLTFTATPHLQQLNLEFNNLTNVPLEPIEESAELEEVCLDGNPIEWTEDFPVFIELYQKRELRGENCNKNETIFLSNTVKYLTTPPSTTKSTESPLEIQAASVNPTLLDALIATYLLVCIILEGLIFAFISLYLARIVRASSKEFDYSTTVLNPSDIYKIN
ncbi:leucine-rich repeat transmembrane protein FLRT3-like [Lutzomyia longipalpis]|uniref:leucine-rich repeat transmembrane protein FLRT3-like n=1 Tax=Lutzomyia longipalpis TaxID=7200 RepID=UPI002483A38F|nr:leucine-rich repeat transmembrane protein FLRT3-like [Lutzomyia longipalpis]